MSGQIHPTRSELALFAGNDLGFWIQRRTGRHVLNCSQCQLEVNALQQARAALIDLNAELPAGLNWNRLSQEMTGNIRVGLAAGECVAGFEKSAHFGRPRIRYTAALLACAMVVITGGLWFNLTSGQRTLLGTALTRIRWDRIGPVRSATLSQDSVVLEASPLAIEVKMNGRALSLTHPRSDGGTVSVNMQDSAGVRYVDADSGQVTINKVYYAQ